MCVCCFRRCPFSDVGTVGGRHKGALGLACQGKPRRGYEGARGEGGARKGFQPAAGPRHSPGAEKGGRRSASHTVPTHRRGVWRVCPGQKGAGAWALGIEKGRKWLETASGTCGEVRTCVVGGPSGPCWGCQASPFPTQKLFKTNNPQVRAPGREPGPTSLGAPT